MATPSNDEFYARALTSLRHQICLGSNAAVTDLEAHAKSLVEDDLPKIDAAVKGFLTLVAARSAIAPEVDIVASTAPVADAVCTLTDHRLALACARTLLSAINSTRLPLSYAAAGLSPSPTLAADDRGAQSDNGGKGSVEQRRNGTKILWNKLVNSPSNGTGDERARQTRPSKVLGRDSLRVAYPYIQERFRRGLQLYNNGSNGASSSAAAVPERASNNDILRSLPDEQLPPVIPPAGIEIDQWEAFYLEFGQLLDRACRGGDNDTAGQRQDDSALLWSGDQGAAELRRRRKARAQRASVARSSWKGGSAMAVAAEAEAVRGAVVEGAAADPATGGGSKAAPEAGMPSAVAACPAPP